MKTLLLAVLMAVFTLCSLPGDGMVLSGAARQAESKIA
jgi:hypothetical protein